MRTNPFETIYRSKDYNNIYKTTVFPYLIDIELTNDCNLLCKFCSRNTMKRKIGYMEDTLFKNIVKQCKKHGTGIRFIRWGEPLLHPKIIEYSRYIKENGLILHITTNGLLLNEEKIKGFIDMGLDSIIISFQGTDRKSYSDIRNNKHYDLLIKNIEKLINIRGEKLKPYIHLTTTTENPEDHKSQKFINKWKDKVDEVTVGRTNWYRVRDPDDIKYIKCKEPWQKLGIDWDGYVSACCADHDRLLNIGYINGENISELWNNNMMGSYRELISSDKHKSLSLCRRCAPYYGDIWKI